MCLYNARPSVHHNKRCDRRFRVTASTWNIGWNAVLITILFVSLFRIHTCHAFAPNVGSLRNLKSKVREIDLNVGRTSQENTNNIQTSIPTTKRSLQNCFARTKLQVFRNHIQQMTAAMKQQRQGLGSPNLFKIQQHFRNVFQRPFQSQSAMMRRCTNLFKLRKVFSMRRLRRAILMLSFAIMISFHTFFTNNVDAAVSGGRMGGGSFKQSTSSSTGRVSTLSRPSIPSTPRTGVYSSPTIRQQHRAPIIINSYSGSRGWYAPTHESALIMSRVSTKDIILVTGTGMLLAYGFRKNNLRGNGDNTDSLLGSGYTVGSMTVSIDVPDRASTDNILNKLNLLALSADTMTKRGLQDLLSSVTLELLRQEQSITSAYTQSKSYPIMGQAEREFQVLSVASQSKVDRLTVNKWNTPVNSGDTKVTSNVVDCTSTAAPTIAIVTINFAMEGDSTILPVIRSRDDLHSALSLIASDALVGDCLMTAEVLWSPEDVSETLSREEMYADFPNLVPI